MHQIPGCASFLCCINSMHIGACAETTLFLLTTELNIVLKVSLMIHLTNQCSSVVQSE